MMDANTPKSSAAIMSGFVAMDLSVFGEKHFPPPVNTVSAMTAKTLYIGTSTALKMDAAAASCAEHVRDEAHAEYDVVAAKKSLNDDAALFRLAHDTRHDDAQHCKQ